jgi:hypothetical protein
MQIISSFSFNNVDGGNSLNLDYATPNQGGEEETFAYIMIETVLTDSGNNSTLNTPFGWNLANEETREPSFTGTYQRIFWKLYDASIGQVTLTSSEDAEINAYMFIVDGVSTSSPNPITVINSQYALASSHPTPGITTPLDNCMLIGIWTGIDSQARFDKPTSMTLALQVAGLGSAGLHPILVATETKGTAGLTGSRTATSKNNNTNATMFANGLSTLLAVNPSQKPSKPELISPNGGETITIGVTFPITYQPATAPGVDQDDLKYKVRYSDNNGSSWSVISSLTSAGVTSVNWNTTGRTAGAQYLIEVSATADNGSTFGPVDISAANLSLVNETAPPPPVNLSPSNNQPKDRTQTIRLEWDYQGGAGNPQTAYSGRYSLNSDMSSPTSFSASSANEFHDISGGTFSAGVTVYWQIKTTGRTLESDWSAVAQFKAVTLPVVNITSPTAGSPPTTSNPTITIQITTGSMAQRRMRVVEGGTEVYNPGYISTNQLSFVSPYSFKDGVSTTLFISVKDGDGAESAENSETFTPSYTGPAEPSLSLSEADGCVQATFINSDTPDSNDLLRDGVLIGEGIAANGTFRDFNVAKGVTYTYIPRAVDSGLVTEGDDESISITLRRLWIHLLTKTSSTSNASGEAISLRNQAPTEWVPRHSAIKHELAGRSEPLTTFGQAEFKEVRATVKILDSEATTLTRLREIYAANSDICVRDQKGNIMFGRIANLEEQKFSTFTLVQIRVERSNYSEALS